MGAGGAWAYRWLTGYLPKRMVNQMKELSSIAYTWWTGGQSTCPSSSGGSPPPGEGSQGGPVTPRPAPPCSLCRAIPAGPQDPGGRGRGGGESYREGEAQANQGGDDVPVHPQEALDPLQAVLGRGQCVGPDCPSRPGHSASAGAWGPSRHWTQARGATRPRTTAPSSRQVLKTGKDKQDGTCLCGDEGLQRSSGACLWVAPERRC